MYIILIVGIICNLFVCMVVVVIINGYLYRLKINYFDNG